ncbi:hypothetical protein WJX84_002884 [Apatococcus fuscideae]|uniref:Uncharacterized protein n=1 Tax=Apatococcus fuscideae TaxID=2026836 RepID=A0AAW1SJZ5_9CHLO
MSVNRDLPDMRDMEIPKAPGSSGVQKGGSAGTIGSESSGVAPGTVTEGGKPKAAQQNVVTRLITRGTTKACSHFVPSCNLS